MKLFTLEVITQEKHLLTETVNSLTVSTTEGELTILADHIPLFSRLNPCEMTYRTNSGQFHFAITGGFINVAPNNIVTILADSAVRSDQINLEEAQKAIEKAKQALVESLDDQTTLKIEMELRNQILKANIAKKHQAGSYNH